ncbi:origin recognition complex, subunit 6 [Ampelomyces quisqualis]|uniref:Origin recognition complex, subunit 6 n=1 Tax=Ampelomyces quisqualis TaxID=50730 RepID=A0A6A5QHP4_AMPQU|nr:origin recognition complex, subunit 6 [Ampelomyces quisqualis]
MSRASVEQALTGLIPALNGPLPPELIDLALSLLARSRSVAHSLKADEEIGRPYACAQLACERSKKRLNLPTIVSRPPCPPRIYKKLYNYLSSALPALDASREPQTPRKRATAASASARNTPKTPLTARTPRTTRTNDGPTAEVSDWVMPAIRNLVKKFDYSVANPHIFTGVETILPLLSRMAIANPETSSKRERRTASASQSTSAALPDARIRALIVVVFLYVYTKMRDIDVTPEQYNEWREIAVNSLLEFPDQDVTYEDLSLETEELMPLAQSEGWLQMEWFLNVTPQQDGDEMEGVETSGAPATRSVTKTGGSDYIGLGTMMQEATDYLGDLQRADYNRWKATIMARVQDMEAA